jgi:hypothetical protein
MNMLNKDARPVKVPGTPEWRDYRACWCDNSTPNMQFCPVLSVIVNGWRNRHTFQDFTKGEDRKPTTQTNMNTNIARTQSMTFLLKQLAVFMIAATFIGCATKSGITAEKSTYIFSAPYATVVDYLKGNGKDFQMSFKNEEGKGVLVFSAFRGASIMTMSVFNMLSGGDKVTVNVTEKNAETTAVQVNSYGKGQVGPDFGRNNKNVRLVLEALEKKFTRVGVE